MPPPTVIPSEFELRQREEASKRKAEEESNTKLVVEQSSKGVPWDGR